MSKDFLPDSDTKHINDASVLEFCGSRYDVIRSETASRIMKVVEKQIHSEKGDRIASLYEKVFIDEFPIASSQRKELQDFLKSDAIRTIGDAVLSKISIQQSDDNKKFIRGFLEGSSGKYSSDRFIQYVLQEFEVYPFVVDIDLLEWESIKPTAVMDGIGELYSYRDACWKYRLFLIDEGNKIIYFNEAFEQEIRILENGLFFSVSRLEENEMCAQQGVFFRYDAIAKQLEQVYAKEWLVSTNALSKKYDFFQTANESWKKWVLKMEKTEANEWNISEILQELYDRIRVCTGGIIVTEDDDARVNGYTTIGMHIESWDDSVCPKKKRIAKTLLWKEMHYWAYHPDINPVKFYDDMDVCRVLTTAGYNYYTIDRHNHMIAPIDWLQWMDISRDDFLDGEPTIVSENWSCCVKIFDRETKTAKDLIRIQNYLHPGLHFIWNGCFMIEFSKIFNVRERYFYLHEWRLFDVKEGFVVVEWYVYKERLFWKVKDLWISLAEGFGKVEAFLKEIRIPAVVITK